MRNMRTARDRLGRLLVGYRAAQHIGGAVAKRSQRNIRIESAATAVGVNKINGRKRERRRAHTSKLRSASPI